MQLTGIPSKFNIPWAYAATGSYIRAVQTASQIGITNGQASLTDGFPPLNFIPVGSGGIPPFGQDFNGILNAITSWNRWQQAGGPIPYDSSFQSAVGGYMKGAIVASQVQLGGVYISTLDNNTNALIDNQLSQTGWTYAFYASSSTVLFFPPQTTFYVNFSTGSDTTGNGLGIGTAWATIQHAINVISSTYVYSGQITIQCANGTIYVPTGENWGALFPASQIGSWSLVGNTASPGSCVIDASAYGCRGVGTVSSASVTISGFTIKSYNEAINVNRDGTVYVGNVNIIGYSLTSCYALSCYTGSLYFLNNAQINISGSFNAAIICQAGFMLIGWHDLTGGSTSVYITFSGATCAAATVYAEDNSTISLDNTYSHLSGTVTGNSVYVDQGRISTSGAGYSVWPGNGTGSVVNYGVYT